MRLKLRSLFKEKSKQDLILNLFLSSKIRHFSQNSLNKPDPHLTLTLTLTLTLSLSHHRSKKKGKSLPLPHQSR